MKVLLMENNLILLSRIRSSLAEHEVRSGNDYRGEEVVLVNLEQFPVETVKTLKDCGAKVIAYCGHKRTDLMEKAKGLGADMVVPNSQIIRAGSLLHML
ncbi:MAG: hypothetical protein RMK75_01140 [Aquificaceae bacterium]|nr:hypothetical protein [Aquificaceae bacterium]MDW8422916.1 hypothetical protein [Aquificaceae bacterium]